MKQLRYLGITILLLSTSCLSAQPYGKLGFSLSALKNNRILNSTSILQDNSVTENSQYVLFGVDYWYPISKTFTAETGIQYSYQPFEKTYSDHSPEKINKNVLTIPVGLRVNFLKYCFINGGGLVDIGDFSGLGSYMGIGARIETLVGFGFYINPYLKVHSVFPFDFDMNADRLVESGIKIGITYSFDNIYSRNSRR